MNNFANISESFQPDAPSSDMLFAQSGQKPGKARETAVRRFEEGKMNSMSNAVPLDRPLAVGQARSRMSGLGSRMSQDQLIDTVVDLASLMAKRSSVIMAMNDRAENIAAAGQTFAVLHDSPQLPACGGAREPWREAG